MEPEEDASLSAGESGAGGVAENDFPAESPLPVRPEDEPESEKKEFDALPQDDEVDLRELRTPGQSLMSRNYVRYPVIFVAALMFFYLFLNFRALSEQIIAIFNPPPENQKVVLADDLDEYNKWIGRYYYFTSDQEVLAANNDADRDGLSNLEEFHLNTNPFLKDTDSDGFDDGQEIINGFNPLYSGSLTAAQTETINKSVDIAKVRARKEFAGESAVAGESLSGDSFAADMNREGRISIAKLGVDVPLVWNKNFEWIQSDLAHGVVHHPDTAIPGRRGLSSIHGHSSGYVWDGDYKNAFSKINLLEAGDEVFVTVFGITGESRSYRYVVRFAQVYEVEDQAQFADQGGYHLNLSTSWPIGTARQRYVVTTELQGL